MHYSKAPITEATIDLHVHPLEEIMLGQLDELQGMLGIDYGEKHNLHYEDFQVDLQMRATAQSSRQIGYWFINGTNSKIVQARVNGMSFSLLAPYSDWKAFSDEAMALWERYRNHVNPGSITRLGVRYINRIDVPLPTIELKEYLATVPEIAPALPQALKQYFMQLVIPLENFGATAVINQALVSPLVSYTTSLMLDIEIFRDREVPQEEEAIREALEQLREAKNLIFEASLTAKAKGLFQ